MYDFIFCNVPKSDVYSPLIGPPILKEILTRNSYTSKILDFNIELFHCFKQIFIDSKINEWVDLDYIFKKGIFNESYKKLLEKWSNKILEYNPRYVGFTCFSAHNFGSIINLSKLIKQKNPEIKIVVGGPCTIWIGGNELIKNKIIDYYVIGYGEEAILKILNGESFIGVNDNQSCRQINLSNNPFPDFSDFDLSKYIGNVLYTYSSRGCTQNCTFCDVNDIWNGYNTRDPKRVVEEMSNGVSKYNTTKFEFCDSLINGSLSNMRGVCNELKLFKFNWVGMFRIRKMLDSDYDLLAESGCTLLKIGIESGSLVVRKDMGKHFTNEEIFATLDNLQRVNIEVALFFITGYPTETEEHHQESLDLITKISNRYSNISHIRSAPVELQKDEFKSIKKQVDKNTVMKDFMR